MNIAFQEADIFDNIDFDRFASTIDVHDPGEKSPVKFRQRANRMGAIDTNVFYQNGLIIGFPAFIDMTISDQRVAGRAAVASMYRFSPLFRS
ncbi:hypothetical protein AU500_04195 [Lonsdalea populi]|uniref:Uncharacterized protein n=2 Tax=Lonsdalea TaxID=1082702 RepID=A0ACD1JFM5_9GAMM|nr:hypothetical protein AU499_10385 [Lonsdalea populi]RAT14668.1 hypothetical protein AU485_05720 [Lonsdalea quercina]RAT18642.1 hypothetical protein AU487_13795 [Lonsdalea populi]RAT24900.1 hypothetical protein AU488_06565 [Lonsdalea populi]RAT25054.1 hypothetical protein AU489_07910 [Lonsdalea populi]